MHSFSTLIFTAAAILSSKLIAAASPDNTVVVDGPDKYCVIVPRDPHTNVGDSEHLGAYITGQGANGQRYAQLTGCIRPETLDRINPSDAGGQYDSSGGAGGQGNPEGSVCVGYNHYVELLEPAGPRLCIRCCDDPEDCPTNKDTDGCPGVIPGNYFNCG
ncbi:hypothetical protein MVEG_01343 [Podila verticillata NRRL 6337]|nr:hypothetical protein MVEG_01343 [Podila verticillata NRRL 6337]